MDAAARETETAGASGVLKREADQTSWFTSNSLVRARGGVRRAQANSERWQALVRKAMKRMPEAEQLSSGRKGWLERLAFSEQRQLLGKEADSNQGLGSAGPRRWRS